MTPNEIESLRIAIAVEMGMDDFHTDPDDGFISSGEWGSRKLVPPYTTSLDAIQAVCLERFKTETDQDVFEIELCRTSLSKKRNNWQLTPLDWCIAFARTAKIWRYKI